MSFIAMAVLAIVAWLSLLTIYAYSAATTDVAGAFSWLLGEFMTQTEKLFEILCLA